MNLRMILTLSLFLIVVSACTMQYRQNRLMQIALDPQRQYEERSNAIKKIKDQEILSRIALEEKSNLRNNAIARLTDTKILSDIAGDSSSDYDARLTAQIRILLLGPEIKKIFGELRPWVNSGQKTAVYVPTPVVPANAMRTESLSESFIQIFISDSKGLHVARYSFKESLPNVISMEDMPSYRGRTAVIFGWDAVHGVFCDLFKNLDAVQLQTILNSSCDYYLKDAARSVIRERESGVK